MDVDSFLRPYLFYFLLLRNVGYARYDLINIRYVFRKRD